MKGWKARFGLTSALQSLSLTVSHASSELTED